MKTFESFNIKDVEDLFLQLIHLDELEIKFDFMHMKTYLFYNYKENYLLIQDKQKNIIFIDDRIIEQMQKDLYLRRVDTIYFIGEMIEKYFGLKNYEIK